MVATMSVSRSPCLSPLYENTEFNVLHRSPEGASVQAPSVNTTQRPYPVQQVCDLPFRCLCTHCCDLLILPRDVAVHIFTLSYQMCLQFVSVMSSPLDNCACPSSGWSVLLITFPGVIVSVNVVCQLRRLAIGQIESWWYTCSIPLLRHADVRDTNH